MPTIPLDAEEGIRVRVSFGVPYVEPREVCGQPTKWNPDRLCDAHLTYEHGTKWCPVCGEARGTLVPPLPKGLRSNLG